MWPPISIDKIELLILQAELTMDYKALNLWNLIKVTPHKWQENRLEMRVGAFGWLPYLEIK
ncbi:conserved hypothetical protein [Sphingobacterium multivorum]|uniref:Uncharacterized protein n=1 Tax=Sphingobacterium multivorum TaxID=28454 RepID=A0A654CLK6_SPHMU|nr:conserved hypothetical protein [Sphingobacterium multivorum]